MILKFATFIIAFTLAFSGVAQQPSLELLASRMTGSFSSKAQAQADTNLLDIGLKMTRIWEEQPEVVWLYVEQAAAKSLKKPYLQRIYQLVELESGKYVLYVFDLPDHQQYIGAHKKPKLFDDISIEELMFLDGCQIGLHYAKGVFKGTTEAKCPTNLGGASIASNYVEIHENKIVSWDRGWTEEGKQVWGPVLGGHELLKK